MAKSNLFFLPLFLTLGVTSCISKVERPLLKSDVDNSIDIIDFNAYTTEPSSYSYSKKPKYTVSFYSRVGNSELCIATRTILEGDRVSPPEDFENPGAVFKGWFLERECINLFNFDDAIYSDTEIFAKWEGGKKAIDFYFSVNDDNATCSLIGYVGENTEISVPSTYSGYKVTKIADDAFVLNTKITKVILPNDVTSIGARAFYNCTSLDTIYLPRGIKSIGADAFGNCKYLQNIYYANTINKWAGIKFAESRSLKYVFNNTVYGTITTFYTLQNDPGESSTVFITDYDYVVPKGINFSKKDHECNDYAFYGLRQLETVSITNNDFTTIGKFAFAYCYHLTRFSINITGVNSNEKKKNKVLRDGAFYCCSNLSDVNDSTYISKLAPYCFYKCESLSTFNFNNDLFIIPAYSFYACPFQRIAFPDNQYKVDILGMYCFAYNQALTELGLRKVSRIEYNALTSCMNIQVFEFGGTRDEWLARERCNLYVPGLSYLTSRLQDA